MTTEKKERKKRGPNRSPEQIIADKEAELAKIRTRMVMNAGETNPVLLPLIKAIETETSNRNQAMVKQKGNNSFEVRKESNRLRQVWIEAQEAYTQVLADFALVRKDYFRDALQAILSSGEPTEESVARVFENVPTNEELTTLETAEESARQAYRIFVAAHKVVANPRKSKAEENSSPPPKKKKQKAQVAQA